MHTYIQLILWQSLYSSGKDFYLYIDQVNIFNFILKSELQGPKEVRTKKACFYNKGIACLSKCLTTPWDRNDQGHVSTHILTVALIEEKYIRY